MAGAVRIAFETPVARAAWDLFCETNGFVHAFRMKGGGDVFRKGGAQVTAWGEGTPDGAPGGTPPAPAGAVSGAIVQAFGTGDPAEAAVAARTVLRAFPASLEAHAEPPAPAPHEARAEPRPPAPHETRAEPHAPAPRGARAEPRAPTPHEARAEPRVPMQREARAAAPAPVRPRPLSRPRAPAAAFSAVPATASEAVALLDREERAALLWLPADGSARHRRGGAHPAEAAEEAVLERLSDWTVGDPRRVVSARLCLCVREHGREATPGPGEFWRLTPLGAAMRGVLQAAAVSASADDDYDDAEAP